MGALTFEPATNIALPAADVALLTLAGKSGRPCRTVHTTAGVLHADFRLLSATYQKLSRNSGAITRSEREVEKA